VLRGKCSETLPSYSNIARDGDRWHYFVAALLVVSVSMVFPIRNANEYLNNKEANAFGSSNAKYLSVGLDVAQASTTSPTITAIDVVHR